MRRALCIALLASGCAHAGIRKVSDCDQVEGVQRVECSACVVQNEAQGWLGTHEYRPDAPEKERCVKVK